MRRAGSPRPAASPDDSAALHYARFGDLTITPGSAIGNYPDDTASSIVTGANDAIVVHDMPHLLASDFVFAGGPVPAAAGDIPPVAPAPRNLPATTVFDLAGAKAGRAASEGAFPPPAFLPFPPQWSWARSGVPQAHGPNETAWRGGGAIHRQRRQGGRGLGG